ncbi:UNVERIFIED_ORG: hypothetical protein ABIC48_001914 [Burkholderia territorii]
MTRLPKKIQDELDALSEQGNVLCDASKFDEAIQRWSAALEFISIIKGGRLWVSDARKANDRQQLRWFKDLAFEHLDTEPKSSEEIKALLVDLDLQCNLIHDISDYFVCYFSEERESVPQWSAYAERGTGYAVGFDVNALRLAIGAPLTISDRDMTKGPISAGRKAVGRHALSVFGGKPKVPEYLHDDLPMAVDILSVADSPDPDLVSYSTIGLFETALGGETELGTRVELCGAMPADIERWPNVLASAAFALMRSRRAVIPRSVLEGYVAEYYSDTLVPHLYLTAPFLWNDGHFKQLDLEGGEKVNWLQGIPISDTELEILRTRGDGEFEDLLEQADVDVFDLYRSSLERPHVSEDTRTLLK